MSHQALNPEQFQGHVEHRVPKGFETSPEECFLNASDLEGWEGTRYAEGHARSGPTGDWTPHAWLVHPKGHVIDPTWGDAGPGFEYREGDPHGRVPT